MSRTDRWILVFLTTLALVVGACAQSSEPETTSDEGPAHIEDIAGSEVKKLDTWIADSACLATACTSAGWPWPRALTAMPESRSR